MSSPVRRTSGRKFKPIKRLPRKKEQDDGTTGDAKQPGKQRFSPNAKLYFTKLAIGGCLGTTSGLLGLDPLLGWTLAIFGIILAGFVVRYVYEITEEQLDQKRLILSGTFSFVLITIVTWSLTWMIMTPELPSPR
ncbi:MAG: hypothetical protein ACFFGZ_10895 [Candidatus Thorarchaeota archaeon]